MREKERGGGRGGVEEKKESKAIIFEALIK